MSDKIIYSYIGELKDFLETITYYKKPQSGFDIAYETVQVIYAAYLSASEGRIVNIE